MRMHAQGFFKHKIEDISIEYLVWVTSKCFVLSTLILSMDKVFI